MIVGEIFDYLIKLERSEYTGSITLNFHKGDLSEKIEEKHFFKVIRKVEEREKIQVR